MRTINYILTVILVIVSFMTVSCNRVKVERRESLQKIVEPSEPIEITNDEIIVLPTTDLFSYKLDAHGLHISDTYFGPKAYKFREEYNFKKYEDCEVNVGYTKKIEAFDVYELGGSGLTLATDVRGLAMRKAGNHFLIFLLTAHNPCLAMRMKYTVKENYVSTTKFGISKNIPVVLFGIEDKENRIIRVLVIPLYTFLKTLPKPETSNFAELTALPGDGLKPQRDTTVVFPCYGDKPQIDCEKDGNGSRIIIRNAEGPGKDASFKIDAAYNYEAHEPYCVKQDAYYAPRDFVGATFGLPNGKFLSIVQCQDKEFVHSYSDSSIDAIDMDGNNDPSGYRTLIFFKNRTRDIISLPFYFPIYEEK